MIDASNDASTFFSFSSCLLSSPTVSALTDAMSESVPFFFCSDFREDIFIDLNWKKNLAVARFGPSTYWSNTWQIRAQDHGVLLYFVFLHLLRISFSSPRVCGRFGNPTIHQALHKFDFSWAIRLWSKDLKHLIPGNGIPKLQALHKFDFSRAILVPGVVFGNHRTK